MPRYRTIPVEVEAVEWTGKNLDAIRELAGHDRIKTTGNDRLIDVYTRQGNVVTGLGWFIVKTANGVISACPPDVFKETYVHVDAGRSI